MPQKPSPPAPVAEAALDAAIRAQLRYGTSALLLFLLGGLSLEFLHLIKAPWYLDHHLRRELWVLGHAHGALLALLNLAWVVVLPRLPAAARGAWALRWGAALVPAGFLLGGVDHRHASRRRAAGLRPVRRRARCLAAPGRRLARRMA